MMKKNILQVFDAALKARSLGKRELEILDEISGTDVMIGFLLSACSKRVAHKIARRRAQDRYRLKNSLRKLKKQGLVTNTRGNKESFMLTEVGKAIFEKENVIKKSTRALEKKKVWDGRWRVVFFDIPQKYNVIRNSLRRVLMKAGFQKIQQSVYVYPHDCDEVLSLLRRHPKAGEYILHITTEKGGGNKAWIKIFDL